MKKKIKFGIFISIFVLLILSLIYYFNKFMLSKEVENLKPLGSIVSVNNNNMSVYTEGDGDKTLVFMSGGGTCSPILDFKSLYSELSDDFRIVVVEKFGYGFSDVTDADRDINSVLNDTREALRLLNISGPFILCPHSMSGIEALYWAKKYPKEVEGIIGLDMATPFHYEDIKINIPFLYFVNFAFKFGFSRLIPFIWKGDAVKHGNLSDDEKQIYRAVFYSKTASKTMINEAKEIKNNAKVVHENGIPQIPILMFVSNGKGTGVNAKNWEEYSVDFVNEVNNGEIIKLNCPHYIHDYLYDDISEEIRIFIDKL